MKKNLLEQISQLSVKMRFLKAAQGEGTDIGELKDREILLLELLSTQGPMSITDILRFFSGVAQSTISADVKRLRTELGLVSKRFGEQDERVHLVKLTEKGTEKVSQFKKQRVKNLAPLQKAFGQDPKELEALSQVVDRALESVDKELAKYETQSG